MRQPIPFVMAIVAWCLAGVANTYAQTAAEALQQVNDFSHAISIDFRESAVRDYEVGLGSMRKVGGAWTFKKSQRFDGQLIRYTWQIIDGFTSLEVLYEIESSVGENEGAELLYACDGRGCGPGVQWANRVFHQRLLYGREDLQRYRVYAVGDNPRSLLLLYSSARTADRQYLHAELLEVTGD